ncbi:FAD-dependent oxidoreductase [Parapedobacter deserti]|uniref:FAD-dependent oxidoreductase n=1 Tax=Parapedobacter deserti TaxID=1912957 RepID=A0ABV7JSU2_9SPHI
MMIHRFIKASLPVLGVITWVVTFSFAQSSKQLDADICIYGATPAGVTAALAAVEEGHKVIVVEPSRWAGGILGAGLKPMQDCPNFEAVGGITRTLLLSLGMENRFENYTEKDVRQAMRTYMSPKVIQEDFKQLLADHKVTVVYEHRVAEVEKHSGKIERIWLDFAPPDATGCPIPLPQAKRSLAVNAKQFIDASYEGDLMAATGVSYRTGRESVAEFSESLAGVRPPAHIIPIDPYRIKGDKNSGLLPWVDADHKKEIGSADRYTQAYNYRFYITEEPKYRTDIVPPADYKPEQYELLGRYVEYVKANKPKDSVLIYLGNIFPGWRNVQDYNYHRNSVFTIAPLGISQLYADGDYATKSEIWKLHQDYLRGIYTFLTTDPRVPEEFRTKTANIGFDKRHFLGSDGWPHQLYVRVTRRMTGEYTVSQSDVYNKQEVVDPVGLAQYGIDTYPSRRYALDRNGETVVAVEGDMFIGGHAGPTKVPYQIPYRAIIPKRSECTNLLVPVCFSATHVGYASGRMEPVFMILGESAGVAASHALKTGVAVQDINRDEYKNALLERGQRLRWPVD